VAIVGVGDSHTSAKAELLRAHGCPIPVLADRYLQSIGAQYIFERLNSVQLYASPSLNSHSVARDGAPVQFIFKVESSAKLKSPA